MVCLYRSLIPVLVQWFLPAIAALRRGGGGSAPGGWKGGAREMENISLGPTFGDLSLSVQRGRSRTHRLQDNRVQEYRLPSPPSFKCNVLRKSLSGQSKYPCATLKRRGSWVISVYLWVGQVPHLVVMAQDAGVAGGAVHLPEPVGQEVVAVQLGVVQDLGVKKLRNMHDYFVSCFRTFWENTITEFAKFRS